MTIKKLRKNTNKKIASIKKNYTNWEKNHQLASVAIKTTGGVVAVGGIATAVSSAVYKHERNKELAIAPQNPAPAPAPQPVPQPAPTKEKKEFFLKRIFGGKKNKQNDPAPAPQPAPQAPANNTPVAPVAPAAPQVPPTPDTQPAPTDSATPAEQ